PYRVAALLDCQGRLYLLERIEVFLQAAHMLFDVRNGKAELACSSERSAGNLGKLGARPRRTRRTANIAEREGSEQRPDNRDTSNHSFCHLWLLSGRLASRWRWLNFQIVARCRVSRPCDTSRTPAGISVPAPWQHQPLRRSWLQGLDFEPTAFELT